MSLTYLETGSPGQPVLVFLHGWPDTAALWRKQLDHFGKHYHCIAFTLPHFDKPSKPFRSYDFSELVELIVKEIRVRVGNEKVVLIGHDWGAYLTYFIDKKYPDLARALVTLDVGAHFKPSSIGHSLFVVGYQWYLSFAYFVGKLIPPLGNFMTRFFARIGKAPRTADIPYQANYPYLYLWRGMLLPKYRSTILRGYRPAKPSLYLYGGRKPWHFHTPYWEKMVTETPGGRVVKMEKSDHWINVREPERTNEVIQSWLAER